MKTKLARKLAYGHQKDNTLYKLSDLVKEFPDGYISINFICGHEVDIVVEDKLTFCQLKESAQFKTLRSSIRWVKTELLEDTNVGLLNAVSLSGPYPGSHSFFEPGEVVELIND